MLLYDFKGRKERNILFNDALNTFYLRSYRIVLLKCVKCGERTRFFRSIIPLGFQRAHSEQVVIAHACHGHTPQLSTGRSV